MSNKDEIIDLIIDLQERGYDHDFMIEHEHIRCLQYDELISPDNFEIVETYYCKHRHDIRNQSIIYGIRLTHYHVKGILISNYKSYTDGMSLQLWQKFDNILRENLAMSA